MAKDNVIPFPNIKEQTDKDKAKMLQLRLDEIDIENRYINEDIKYLQASLKKNHEEAEAILKAFAMINGGKTPVMEFENEWGDDFEFTPDFELPETAIEETKDETTKKWDELSDTLDDAARKLTEAVVQLTLDLDINKDKPKDKE